MDTCEETLGRNALKLPKVKAQAIRDAVEEVKFADEFGLDVFGFGEHHTRSMPVSSPTALVNAAAS